MQPGAFWPAIAEAEVYIDNGAEETVELENIAATRKQSLTLKSEVNASADKAKITDNDETTASPLQEKTFAAGSSETFAEVGFGVEQKMRQIILALPKDNQNASYTYKLYGKATKNGSYETQPFATGNINTGDANKVKINAADVDSAVKDLEYESVKAVFEAATMTEKITSCLWQSSRSLQTKQRSQRRILKISYGKAPHCTAITVRTP